jgi:hypothetical protein
VVTSALNSGRFSALARSSPWRWRTLRFTVAWQPRTRRPPGVQAWVRRPDGLLVADPHGNVLAAELAERPWGTSVSRMPDGRRVERELYGPLDPRATPPELNADGFVLSRPVAGGLCYDDPMFTDYRWVAMLDPAELADGVQVTNLVEVEHHDRPAWQADLRPGPAYDPRCSCCPLLFSAVSEDYEAAAGGPTLRERNPDLRYADAHRVRLDVRTGVCVYTEELGGSRAGEGHDLRIEAVDEPMPNWLFTDR